MTEEDLKQTIENLLQIQTNNEYNFQLLQAQVDDLRKQISDLSEIRVGVQTKHLLTEGCLSVFPVASCPSLPTDSGS